MHRLLQGDVGSGKTVVAVCAFLVAVQGGSPGGVHGPHRGLGRAALPGCPRAAGRPSSSPDPGSSRWAAGRLRSSLLTGRTPAGERAKLHAASAGRRSIDLVVGTHALLTEEVRFSSLGVVVIDEQHRFGVEQRNTLRAKGRDASEGEGADPDLLVMTATPIPRTAAMVFFGDLDVTELNELPTGRLPVHTEWARTEADEKAAWSRVRDEVAAGNRVYVVCPLVEGSERIQAKSATEERVRLESTVLSGLRIGLLHGQLKASDKERRHG
jgi:ATP-dependent DNA helicase RecG